MAAQAQPNSLLFSKILGKTDINYRLAFPTKILGLLFFHALQVLQGGRAAEIVVWDVKNHKLRKFVCRIRKGRHPKPVLSDRGWRGFVKENKLEVGDRVLFFQEIADDHGVNFSIDLERATTNIESAAPADGTDISTASVVSLTTIASNHKSAIDMDAVDTTLKLSI